MAAKWHKLRESDVSRNLKEKTGKWACKQANARSIGMHSSFCWCQCDSARHAAHASSIDWSEQVLARKRSTLTEADAIEANWSIELISFGDFRRSRHNRRRCRRCRRPLAGARAWIKDLQLRLLQCWWIYRQQTAGVVERREEERRRCDTIILSIVHHVFIDVSF